MLNEERTDVSGRSVSDLRAEYEADLAAVIDDVGIEAVIANTDLDEETVQALADGQSPTIDLEDAAAVLALDDDAPGGSSIYVEATDHLLMGMSMAVLDVERLAADVDLDAGPREIQQKLERRSPMTLAEFAALEHCIASQR